MCSHHHAVQARQAFERMGIRLAAHWLPPPGPADVWPGYRAPFVRWPREVDSGDEAVLPHEVLSGVFGLLPHRAKDEKLARSTYNARSETLASKPSFREAWKKKAQHGLIPTEAFYEPDWRSGKAVPTRISRADGEPMGLAGLWERWRNPAGEIVHSMTMLTVNADRHPLTQNFHKPTDEKRMVVILPKAQYEEWLDAPAERSMAFMTRFPADRLVAVAKPRA